VYTSTGKGFVGNNMFAYCLNNPVNMIDIDGRDPIPQWATRIINGEGTEEDYETALSVNADAWVGYARRTVDMAIEIAKSRASQMTNSCFGSPKQFSLYDSDRFEDKTPFRGTIFTVGGSLPSYDREDESIGFGALEVDFSTGGWEWQNASFMLLDIGHAEVGLQIKDGEVSAGAFVSLWSPKISIDFGWFAIEIGAEVGCAGIGFHKDKGGFGFSWGGGPLGFSINVSR